MKVNPHEYQGRGDTCETCDRPRNHRIHDEKYQQAKAAYTAIDKAESTFAALAESDVSTGGAFTGQLELQHTPSDDPRWVVPWDVREQIAAQERRRIATHLELHAAKVRRDYRDQAERLGMSGVAAEVEHGAMMYEAAARLVAKNFEE